MPQEPQETNIDPVTGSIIVQGIASAGQAISRGGPRRQYKWNKRAANDANQMNRDNALWTLEQNKKLQQEQRVYDSPASQMARYREAGLNPHLIYGNGSSAGGAFPNTAPQISPSRIDAPSASYPDVVGSFLSAGQTIAQTELTHAKETESLHRSALIGVQERIAETNPMLNSSVYISLTESMKAVADAKANEAKVNWMVREETSDGRWSRYTIGERKIEQEVELQLQKLGLNTTDQKIKNQILESKAFENMIKEVQAKWLKDGDITPEHIYQGLMLFLQKMITVGYK